MPLGRVSLMYQRQLALLPGLYYSLPLNNMELKCAVPLIWKFFTVQYCQCYFPYDLLKYIFFSLTDLIIRIQYILHKQNMCSLLMLIGYGSWSTVGP